MDFENLCPGCMREVENRSQMKYCPHCGYDLGNMQAAPHQLQPFTILNGKYIIGKVIGEGGFGITYLGADINLNMPVAIKEFYPNGFVTREAQVTSQMTIFAGNNQQAVEKWRDGFLREAQTLAKLTELQGIVQVRDYFDENNTSYIVMEYVDGTTLKSYLKQNGGKLPVQEVLRMIEPVIQSLAQVHRENIIHRDISPDNIMMTHSGTMKLLDFGAARDVSSNKSLSIMLKPGYAPEEQYRTRGEQGPWSDVYALCGTIYKCITGKTPPEALERSRNDTLLPPSSYGIQISPQQEQAIMQGLAVYKENRIQSMDELHQRLFGTSTIGGSTGIIIEDRYGIIGGGGDGTTGGGNGTTGGGNGTTGEGEGTTGGGDGTTGGGTGKKTDDDSKDKRIIFLLVIVGVTILVIIILLAVILLGRRDTSTSASKAEESIESVSAKQKDETRQLDEEEESENENILEGDKFIKEQDYVSAFNAYLKVGERDKDYSIAYDRVHQHLGTYVDYIKSLKEQAQNAPNYNNFVDAINQMDEASDILDQMLEFYPEFYEEYCDEIVYVTAETENAMAGWSIDRAAEYTAAQEFDAADDLLVKVKNYVLDRPDTQYHEEFVPFYLQRYYKGYAQNEIQRAAIRGARGDQAVDIASTIAQSIVESDYNGYLIELYEHYAHDAGIIYPYGAYSSDRNYVLPESSQREYSAAELANLDITALRIARYEIYARHNRKFSDPTVQKYFDSRVWYSGTVEANIFDESQLSDVEKENIRTIFQCEIEQGYF